MCRNPGRPSRSSLAQRRRDRGRTLHIYPPPDSVTHSHQYRDSNPSSASVATASLDSGRASTETRQHPRRPSQDSCRYSDQTESRRKKGQCGSSLRSTQRNSKAVCAQRYGPHPRRTAPRPPCPLLNLLLAEMERESWPRTGTVAVSFCPSRT